MNINSTCSRGVLVVIIVAIRTTKLFCDDDLSYTIKNQGRRIIWGAGRVFLVQLNIYDHFW
jgi:hypothetical protein